MLDTQGKAFSLAKAREACLAVSWGDRQALFTEEGIRIKGLRESFLDAAGCPTQPKAREDRILSCHEGHRYALRVAGGTVAAKDGGFLILSQEEEFTLFPENI